MQPAKCYGLQKRSRSLSPRPWQGVASCLTIMCWPPVDWGITDRRSPSDCCQTRMSSSALEPGSSNRKPTGSRTICLPRQRAALESEISEMVASDSRPLHPIRVIRKIRDAFPRHATVAIDVGVLAQGMGGAFPYFKIYQPRSTIVPSSFYGMGFSASAFPVARLVYPDRPAVCLVGDGSFQMVMNILPVAAELKLGVTWCILNDGALGSIRDIQAQAFSERYIGTEFALDLDFAKLAQASGCYGERVTEPAEIENALKRAIDANEGGRPAVLDFFVAKERLKGSVEFFKR